ncbi:MAG: DUF1799 domain-containing protein [Rhodocyclaceae bacterium]|nr:DUF1799 domain-containing protein [Rhodocyclaceae bacterium]
MYACNWPAYELWAQTWRQWRWVSAGMAGAVRAGLDWCQVEAVMRMRGIGRRERPALLLALRVMESAAIEEMARLAEAHSEVPPAPRRSRGV